MSHTATYGTLKIVSSGYKILTVYFPCNFEFWNGIFAEIEPKMTNREE